MKASSFQARRRWWLLAVAVAVGLGTSAGRPAQAAPDARATEAKKACLAGRWEQGIELLADLYAESNDANYIYNQARCFQQNGRGQDAVTRFREYLRKAPEVSAGERAQVEGYIHELQSAAPVAPAPSAPGDAAAATVVASGATADGDRRRALRLGGITIASVGALITAGGIVMGLRVRTLSDEVSKSAAQGRFEQGKYDAGRRAETLQWVGIGVGAAAIVAGSALLVIAGRDPAREAPTTALVAPVLEVGAGAVVAGGTVRVTF